MTIPRQTPDSPLFVFSRSEDRWECRPTGMWVYLGFGFFLFGAAFLLYLGGKFYWPSADHVRRFGFGALMLVGAVLLTWMAWRYWQLRCIPLTVSGTGRVAYGEQELCPAGSVRSVRIEPDPQAESGDCKLVLERMDGSNTTLPGPFFGAVSHRESARTLADELARALKVEVVETK